MSKEFNSLHFVQDFRFSQQENSNCGLLACEPMFCLSDMKWNILPVQVHTSKQNVAATITYTIHEK
jgi:hypothetical protein